MTDKELREYPKISDEECIKLLKDAKVHEPRDAEGKIDILEYMLK